MEEPAFLLAVDRIVGGVEVEHDLLGRPRMRIEEDVHEQRFQARRIAIDLVILLGVALRRVLQPVERALAGHRRTARALGLELAGQNREHRIVTQFVMIVEVVIAQSQAEHALADQGLDRVLEQPRIPTIRETGGHPRDQAEAAIQSPQKQRSRIRCDGSAIEPGHHFLALDGFKIEQRRGTLCLYRGTSETRVMA